MLTLKKAQTILKVTLATAREKSMKPLAVVVMDERGAIRVAAAEDGTSLARMNIAIGKAKGAWSLADKANESERGFLLNHLIKEELPAAGGTTVSNADPITGQAGWYDVRVRLRPAAPDDADESFPQVAATPPAPGVRGVTGQVLAYFAGRKA